MASKVMACYDPFVAQLTKALGLPKHVRWFELRAAVDEAVTVRCEYFPDANNAEGFDPIPLLSEYRLTACGGRASPWVDEPRPGISRRTAFLLGSLVCGVPLFVLVCALQGA